MNLLSRLNKLTDDDAAVKMMFDHVRNVGLCALVLGASGVALTEPERFGPVVGTLIFGTILGMAGLLMTIVNVMHGLKKARALSHPIEQTFFILAVNAGAIVAAYLLSTPLRGT